MMKYFLFGMLISLVIIPMSDNLVSFFNYLVQWTTSFMDLQLLKIQNKIDGKTNSISPIGFSATNNEENEEKESLND